MSGIYMHRRGRGGEGILPGYQLNCTRAPARAAGSRARARSDTRGGRRDSIGIKSYSVPRATLKIKYNTCRLAGAQSQAPILEMQRARASA